MTEMRSSFRRPPRPRVGLGNLEVQLSSSMAAPGPDFNLLAGFRFGKDSRVQDPPAVINLKLAPLGPESALESWWYRGPVTCSSQGPARIAKCADYAVVSVQHSGVVGGDIRSATRDAYLHLLSGVHSTGHPRVVKIWNYFGNINQGDDDCETYRQFSLGRAEIFQEMGITDKLFPAGTAIGTPGVEGLTLVALATRFGVDWVENPRQISAFNYPRRYGPRSPKFSRGGLVSSGDHRSFFISGTAAVVGHESAYPFDVVRQVGETVQNLGELWQAGSTVGLTERRLAPGGKYIVRIYVRNPADYPVVARELQDYLGANVDHAIFLHGDICRKDLMVEIDGVSIQSLQPHSAVSS